MISLTRIRALFKVTVAAFVMIVVSGGFLILPLFSADLAIVEFASANKAGVYLVLYAVCVPLPREDGEDAKILCSSKSCVGRNWFIHSFTAPIKASELSTTTSSPYLTPGLSRDPTLTPLTVNHPTRTVIDYFIIFYQINSVVFPGT